MRVLVVGGTGFLGTHISLALTGQGYEVSVAGRESLAQALESNASAIVWAAGGRANTREELQEQHIDAPLRALATLGAGNRFVFLSSGEVYGPSKVPFCEGAVATGSSDYALAKIAGEEVLRSAAEKQGVKLVCFRVALAYGQGQVGSMFLPSLVRHLVERAPFATSPGAQTRDFIYASDVADATAMALANGAPTGLFNLGSGVEISLQEMACRVQREFDEQSGLSSLELLRFGELPYRVNEQMRYLLNMDKTKSDLGFVPKVDLAEGIARLVSAARQ